MPRSGGGVYSLPAGSIVTDGVDDILASQHNDPLNDLALDMNTARPIVAGGTGATTAPAALIALGLTATAAEINVLDGLTSSTAELNILDGVTATATELNYVDGVTSAIQTQLDAKQASDADLTAIAGLASSGMISRTGSGTAAARTITAGTGISVTDGDGVSGNPTIAAPGAAVLLARKTASASATLDFTEFANSTYSRYLFVLKNVKPATDNVDLYGRVSTNAGVSYDAGASDYNWTLSGSGNVTFGVNSAADVAITVASVVGNAANENGVTGTLELFNAESASIRARAMVRVAWENTSTISFQGVGQGVRLAAQDTDAFRFLFSSGNIASGKIEMWGLV